MRCVCRTERGESCSADDCIARQNQIRETRVAIARAHRAWAKRKKPHLLREDAHTS